MKLRTGTDYFDRTLENFLGGRGAWGNNVAEGAEIGIEIEVEGRGLPRNGLTGWAIHEDGSLRGESAEYVFRNPEPRAMVPTRLQLLDAKLREVNAVVNQSYRTSVHVHMNARNLLIKQIYNWIMLYVICEDILGEFAGNERIGNLFCLRAKDAQYFLEQLRQAIERDNITLLRSDNLRYSAVNPLALFNHGSLEFRALRGTTDIEVIQQWVNLLTAIKDAATNFENPIQIVQSFSERGADGFAQNIFERSQIDLFGRGWQEKLHNGVQLIQHIAYTHDWVYEGPAKKSSKKKAATLDAYTAAAADLGQLRRHVFINQAVGRAPEWAQPQPAQVQNVPDWVDDDEPLDDFLDEVNEEEL